MIGAHTRKRLAHRVRQGVLTVTTIAVLALAVTIIEDRSRGMSPVTAPHLSQAELHSVSAQGQRVITEMIDEIVDESRLHTLLVAFSVVGIALLIVLVRT